MTNNNFYHVYSSLDFCGDVFISIYPQEKFIHIDYSRGNAFSKSFFCDFYGNIICPKRMNSLLKHCSNSEHPKFFFYRKIKLIFLNENFENESINEGNIYLNGSSIDDNCIIKLIYMSPHHSIGVIEKFQSQELKECLSLIPKKMKDWQKLIVNDEAVQFISR